ncbi:MAG: Crp/Fnr family transcriptional regulator [Paracoccus sp. (in: a-proteobacteria)]|nr:Crp/Fnr family transcriptional regulator [Paracoccus sp. (in: a-proteobacteria)]
MKTGYWHLTSISWLDHLPAEALADLRRSSQVQVLARGDTVFSPTPDPQMVFLLESGICRIFGLSPEGEEFTHGLVVRGEVFGELPILDGAPRDCFAVAHEKSIVWRFPRQVFLELMASGPEAAMVITKQIAGRMRRFQMRAEDLVFHHVPARLARVLLLLADELGEATPAGTRIGARFTQAELASLIGASRPTVSLSLGELRSNGLIGMDEGRIVILSPHGLAATAGEPQPQRASHD